MTSRIAALCLVAAAGLLTGADAPESKNLVFNGSFEQPGKDKPAGWHTQAHKPEYITGEAGQDVHTGTRAVKLSEPQGFHERWAANNDKRVEVEGGAKYRYTAWVKVPETWKREYVQLRAEQFDGEGKLIKEGENPFLNGPKERPTGGEWTQISNEFTTAPNAKLIRPLLALTNGGIEGSQAWVIFDDVSIEKVQ